MAPPSDLMSDPVFVARLRQLLAGIEDTEKSPAPVAAPVVATPWGGATVGATPPAPDVPAPPVAAPSPETPTLAVGDLVASDVVDAEGVVTDTTWGVVVDVVDLGANAAYNGPLDSDGRPTRNANLAARVAWLSVSTHPVQVDTLRRVGA